MSAGMSLLRKLLVGGYYYSTLPLRIGTLSVAKHTRTAPIAVLFYHRVADDNMNDWTISNAAFRQQMEWLRRRFDVVSLADAQRRILDGNPRPAVSVTFDDGYAENCDQALPWLIEQQVPVTYFVTTNSVFHGDVFPHECEHRSPAPPNTVAQLQALARAGVEIGAHSRSHPNLHEIDDPAVLFDEVVRSRDELQDAIGHRVRYFAFPYGQREHLNEQVFELARQHGFDAVCSTLGGYHFPGDDPFHIRRIHGDPNFIRFKNWIHADPRLFRSRRMATSQS